MSKDTINNVPKKDVGAIVQSYVEDGAISVVARRQSDGQWTITATFV